MTCGTVAGSSATVYGSGPRRIATSPGVTRTGSRSASTIQAAPLTTVTSVSGASSWMRSAHGGSSTERSRNALRARGPSSRSASGSMAAV